ncbi:MAG: hypothetical protein ACK2TV_03870, partial [Anaerolineales bacterium]
ISGLLLLVLTLVIYLKTTRKFDRYVGIEIPMPIVIEQLARSCVYSLHIVFKKKTYHDLGGHPIGEFDFSGNATLFDKIISFINTLSVFVFLGSLNTLAAIDFVFT